MRGEYRFLSLLLAMFTGSPPHAWGILADDNSFQSDIGITPTCVGNTLNDSRHNSIFKLVNVHFL